MYPITGEPYTLGFALPFRRPGPGLGGPYWRCRLYLVIGNSPCPLPAPQGCAGRAATASPGLPLWFGVGCLCIC